jgi:multidrug efflux pump subunit AcrB
MDDEALSWFVDNTVSKALLSARGVGAVSRVGGVTREVRVELDPRMLALNATAADISRQLRASSRRRQAASDVGGIEQSVRTLATVQRPTNWAAWTSCCPTAGMSASIRWPGQRHGRRTAHGGAAQRQAGGRLRGHAQQGAGEIEVRDNVLVALGKLKGEHPDIEITEAFNFVDPVVENYEGSMKLLIEGALLAVLVVWLFLRDARATFVSAAALPLSAIPTFFVMYLMGFTLNVVTLLSMSLVVGILVDDAIVEIENIMRHLRMGKTPYQAAMEAADEIGLAVIATTFTLIAVFLPTAFMSGVAGKFFVQFGGRRPSPCSLAGRRPHADADDGGLHPEAGGR